MHVVTNLVALFWRRKKRPAARAFILCGSVLANSLMTDYELGVFGLYRFEVHGILDYADAASSAATPSMMGFANKRQAKYFYAQAVASLSVRGSRITKTISGATRTGMRLDDRARLRVA